MVSKTIRVLAVVLVTSLVVVSQGDRGQVAAKSAVLTFMYGDVQVRHGASGWQTAQTNETLQPLDAVKTGDDARAELTLAGGGYVRMDENSHLLISHLQDDGVTSFKALLGGVWVTLEQALGRKSKFEVEMPSAVASVQGTVFRCEVDEEGNSSTYVYDGEVDIRAGDAVEKVQPDHQATVRRGTRIALAKMSLDAEDRLAWVQHNRQRDVLQHLGNPKILVALSNGHGKEARAAFEASKSLTQALRRAGFKGTSVTHADKSKYTFNEDGWIRWKEQHDADYLILGRVDVKETRAINTDRHSARAMGGAYVVPAGSQKHIARATAQVRGEGDSQDEAAGSAVKILGLRLGKELVPLLINELMQSRGKMVRIELLGDPGRAQVGLLKMALKASQKVTRVTIVPTPSNNPALAVAGDLDPYAVAAVLRKACNVEQVLVIGRTVKIRLKPMENQPQVPSAQKIRQLKQKHPAGQRGEPNRPFGRRPRQ
ncbi:MAG: FecR family protein [Armatimonadota bacterium]